MFAGQTKNGVEVEVDVELERKIAGVVVVASRPIACSTCRTNPKRTALTALMSDGR